MILNWSEHGVKIWIHGVKIFFTPRERDFFFTLLVKIHKPGFPVEGHKYACPTNEF